VLDSECIAVMFDILDLHILLHVECEDK